MSLNERFSSNIDLITDAQILHPSSFDENLNPTMHSVVFEQQPL